MDAKKPSCPTRTALLIAWHAATKACANAVNELARKIGNISKKEYEKLAERAENTRVRMTQAQAKFEKHTRDHGCDEKW